MNAEPIHHHEKPPQDVAVDEILSTTVKPPPIFPDTTPQHKDVNLPDPNVKVSPSTNNSVHKPVTKIAGAKRDACNASLEYIPAPGDDSKQHLCEKKLRRLEKNRLSARECRRRKREATLELEREILKLEGENLKLRLQLQIGEEAEISSQKEQERLMESLDTLLKGGAPEHEVYATIEEYKEKFADYGRDRRSAIEFHIRNISRLLMPTTTTYVAMAALKGGTGTDSNKKPEVNHLNGMTKIDSTCNPNNISTSIPNPPPISAPPEPKKLFQHLVDYLQVSPEQASSLKDSRYVSKELDTALVQSCTLLEELHQRLTQFGDDLEIQFDSVRAILTPTQAAKFLIWVANNGACTYMLNELWKNIYSKPKYLNMDAAVAAPNGSNSSE